MTILKAKVWDNTGNKAEIEVTEFKTLKDAIKVIKELQDEITNLKSEIKKIKNGKPPR